MPTAVTQRYKVFDKTMDRVEGLLDLHPRLHGIQGRPKQHVSDILRGALVLAVGALDGLVLDSVIAAVPSAAKKGRLGPNVAKWVREDPQKILDGFASSDPTQKLTELCRDNMGVLTFQRSSMIEGVLRDVVNCDPPWRRAARILADEDLGWTPTPDSVKQRLDSFVERRHQIAHSGDLLPGSESTKPIRLDYVSEAAVVIRAVGLGVRRALAAV